MDRAIPVGSPGESILLCVAATIAHFIAVEVLDVAWRMFGCRPLAVPRHRTMIAVVRVEVVVDVAVEVCRTMEPWARADEDAAVEPPRPVIAVRSAGVRCVIEIAIWANRFRPVLHAITDLNRTVTAPEEQEKRGCNQKASES